jgi:thymidylate synthase ThyX
MLLRCGGCGRGGLAVVHDNGQVHDGILEAFYPTCPDKAALPVSVPSEIVKEFREAELCAAHQAWRASSAMLRSVLEKTLKINGYTTGNLKNKIDEAAIDSVITEARKNRAQLEIRVLGNDILHDAWREVKAEEYSLAHHYAQRILEDFYDNRADVEILLNAKGRIP